MGTLTPEELRQVQRSRYSIKKFDAARGIPSSAWSALEESLWLTPSAYNLQPWKFIVITDDELKARLRPHAYRQAQVEECSHLVVFCALKTLEQSWIDDLMRVTAAARGVGVQELTGYSQMITNDLLVERPAQAALMSEQHCYLALGNLITSAAVLGIDSCPLEGFVRSEFDQILQLTDTPWRSVVLCALGYQDFYTKGDPLPRARFEQRQVVEHR